MFIGRTGRSTLRFYKKRTVNANLEVFKEHRTFDLEVYEEDRTVKANFKVYMEDKLFGSRFTRRTGRSVRGGTGCRVVGITTLGTFIDRLVLYNVNQYV